MFNALKKRMISFVTNDVLQKNELFKHITKQREIIEKNITEFRDDNTACFKTLEKKYFVENTKLDDTIAVNREILWATIFRDSIRNCKWLESTDFRLGRWAAGYPLLYVLFVTLQKCKPTRILEFGLGETSKLFSSYVRNNHRVKHICVEHDLDWIRFFLADAPSDFLDNTEIIQCEQGMFKFENTEVRRFIDLGEKLPLKKFDLILIDAPLGGDMKDFSRVDILDLLPEIVPESFVIILDDTHRVGEVHTLHRIKEKLSKHNIDYLSGFYEGQKKFSVICSKNNKFLLTL